MPEMTKEMVYQFINQEKLAIVSTVNLRNRPEAALVGIAVSLKSRNNLRYS